MFKLMDKNIITILAHKISLSGSISAQQVTTFYIPEAIRDSSLCGMCGAECTFCENVTI